MQGAGAPTSRSSSLCATGHDSVFGSWRRIEKESNHYLSSVVESSYDPSRYTHAEDLSQHKGKGLEALYKTALKSVQISVCPGSLCRSVFKTVVNKEPHLYRHVCVRKERAPSKSVNL